MVLTPTTPKGNQAILNTLWSVNPPPPHRRWCGGLSRTSVTAPSSSSPSSPCRSAFHRVRDIKSYRLHLITFLFSLILLFLLHWARCCVRNQHADPSRAYSLWDLSGPLSHNRAVSANFKLKASAFSTFHLHSFLFVVSHLYFELQITKPVFL